MASLDMGCIWASYRYLPAGFLCGFWKQCHFEVSCFQIRWQPVINQTVGMPSLDSRVVTPSVFPILGTRKLPLASQGPVAQAELTDWGLT